MYTFQKAGNKIHYSNLVNFNTLRFQILSHIRHLKADDYFLKPILITCVTIKRKVDQNTKRNFGNTNWFSYNQNYYNSMG